MIDWKSLTRSVFPETGAATRIIDGRTAEYRLSDGRILQGRRTHWAVGDGFVENKFLVPHFCMEGVWRVPLPDNEMSYLDESDIEIATGRNWNRSHCAGKKTYVKAHIWDKESQRQRTKNLHSMILKTPKWVDHADRNPLNNRRYNLRESSVSQNTQNQSGRSKFGFKGVAKGQRGGYRATITSNGITKRLGSFKTPQLAAESYNHAALELHGEFAVLNKV